VAIHLAAAVVGVATWGVAVAQPPSDPSSAGAAGGELSFPEYRIKAAYLRRFMLYVEWPESAFEKADSPLVLGIVGRDPFDHHLDEVFAKPLAGGRRVEVRKLRDPADARDCHLVFFSSRYRQAERLELLRGRPVLTVGEDEDFLASGGGIRLLTIGRSIRFEINRDVIREAKLRFNPQALRLAVRIVDSEAGTDGRKGEERGSHDLDP
jgi:hypothetical protein